MPDPSPLSDALQSLARRVAVIIESDAELRDGLLRTLRALYSPPQAEPTPAPQKKIEAKLPAPPPKPAGPRKTVMVSIDGQHVEVQVPEEAGVVGGVGVAAPHYTPPSYAGPRVVEPAPTWHREMGDDPVQAIDLSAVARRLKIKAAAARAVAEGADPAAALAERDRCDASTRLWVLELHDPAPDALRDLAGCYAAAADAADLARQVEADPKLEGRLSEALHLLAEAQSSIRDAISAFEDAPRRDEDQYGIYLWLKDVTWDRRVKIERYMTLEPVAPRGNWADVASRVAAAAAPLADRGRREKLLKKVQYHAGRVAKVDEDLADAEWERLYAAIDGAVEAGVPASDLTLRATLMPLIDELPDEEPPKNARLVFDEIDHHRTAVEQDVADEEDAPVRGPSETLLAARELLGGRSAVLIGGLPRENHRVRLVRELGMDNLNWVKVLHHQSLEAVVLPEVRRPEVSVVFTMTRWRSHAVGPAVRKWCKEFGKTLVELPAGYSPEQVAHQVMTQASRELSGTAAAAS